MKKIKKSIGIMALMGLAVLNFTQSESNFLRRSLASDSSDSGTSGSNSSSSVNHAGGTAHKKCPIWNIDYITEIGLPLPKVTISCKTGGEYKCEDGTCPHGV